MPRSAADQRYWLYIWNLLTKYHRVGSQPPATLVSWAGSYGWHLKTQPHMIQLTLIAALGVIFLVDILVAVIGSLWHFHYRTKRSHRRHVHLNLSLLINSEISPQASESHMLLQKAMSMTSYHLLLLCGYVKGVWTREKPWLGGYCQGSPYRMS